MARVAGTSLRKSCGTETPLERLNGVLVHGWPSRRSTRAATSERVNSPYPNRISRLSTSFLGVPFTGHIHSSWDRHSSGEGARRRDSSSAFSKADSVR